MPDQIPSPVPWLVDPTLMVSMRREHAEAALRQGHFDKALSESEELLQDNPSDAGALWISARAALSLGDACTAEVALAQLIAMPSNAQPADIATLHTELSFARFLQADFVGAKASAETALTEDSLSASAWTFLGIAEERLGNADAASLAFAKADHIRPGSAPRHSSEPPLDSWQHFLDDAKSQLHPDEAALVDQLTVEWQHTPTADVLRSVAPPISPFVDLLISGDEASDQTSDEGLLDQLDAALRNAVPSPTLLTLYRHNLLRGQPSPAEIVDRLAVALRLEISAWLGVPFDEVEPVAR